MTKRELVEWLVNWRQEAKGSISPHNHRKLLLSRSKADLQRMYERIREGEQRAARKH